MTSSRANSVPGWLALAVAATALCGTAGSPAALAQEVGTGDATAAVGQPVVLTTPTLLTPEPGGEAPPEPGEEAGNAVPSPEGIEVNRLAEIDPDAVGTLDPKDGGFGPDLWRGSERRTVERLLPRLPGAGRSAAMRHGDSSAATMASAAGDWRNRVGISLITSDSPSVFGDR